MQTQDLKDLLHSYHSGNHHALDMIIEKMNPLISHYSKKLFFFEREDAMQEMILTLIKTTQQIENYKDEHQCLAYYRSAVHNRYLELLRQHYNKEEFLNVSELLDIIPDTRFDNSLQILFITQMIEHSSELSKTKKIIFYKLLKGYSTLEIAAQMNLSRQYVHKVKTQLKELFLKE